MKTSGWGILIAAVVVFFAVPWITQGKSPAATWNNVVGWLGSLGRDERNPSQATDGSISAAQLQLASAVVRCRWESYHELASNDVSGCQGSAIVLGLTPDRRQLNLLTNAHCLSLRELGKSAYDQQPHVVDYRLVVQFPSGTEARVTTFGIFAGGVDLAYLWVDSSGLSEGRDYVVLRNRGDLAINAGDETVAVGCPQGLAGTQTFGHISAIRADNNGVLQWIQTDTALNPGNSGGPLFLKQYGRYYWIGVNTQIVTQSGGSEGLNFAIHAKGIGSVNHTYFDADKKGAAGALRNVYGVDAYWRQ
ncbi:MAG: trypsin-like peptidase domain-containing protein [Planctomycetes bacterium]|nr:trypsin-like peptidase domain-containing protein [Planctomycetota bacterium]